MATLKQKKAIENIVENHGNIGKAMIQAGYDLTTAKNPKNLTDSKGFKEVCDEYGLTESLIVGSLVDDIKANKGKRVPELTLAAKIMGLEKTPDSPPYNPIFILLQAYGLIEGGTDDTKTDGAIQGTSQSAT